MIPLVPLIPFRMYLSESHRVRLVIDQAQDMAYMDVDHFWGGKEVRKMLKRAAILGYEPDVDDLPVETHTRFLRYYLVQAGASLVELASDESDLQRLADDVVSDLTSGYAIPTQRETSALSESV